jgi:hypothetical protein
MAEENQHAMELNQLVELLIKHNNVHEGRWSIMVGFQIGVGAYGPAEQTYPGAAVTIQQIGIQRVEPGVQIAPGAFVLDAAEVNPIAPSQKKAK